MRQKLSSLYVFLYLLLTLGYLFSVGFYQFGELLILAVVFVILLLIFLKENIVEKLISLPKPELLLILVLIISFALQGALFKIEGPGWKFFSATSRFLIAINFLLSMTFLFKDFNKSLTRIRFPLMIVGALGVQLLTILASPFPSIDVFYSIREATTTFWKGQNPYLMNTPSPYGVYAPKIIYVYGPAPLFLFAPFVFLLNDPRFLYLIANALNAFLFWKLSKNQVLPLVYLSHPLFPFIVDRSWIDSLIVSFFLIMILIIKNKARDFLTNFFLVIIGLIKIFYFAPLLIFSYKLKYFRKRLLVSLILVFILTLPFIVWGKEAFSKRMFYFLGDPAVYSYENGLSRNSLNLHAFFFKYTGIDLPNFIHLFLIGALLLMVFLKQKSGLINYCKGVTLAFLGLFLLTPFTFFNYYFFVGSLILATIAVNLSKG